MIFHFKIGGVLKEAGSGKCEQTLYLFHGEDSGDHAVSFTHFFDECLLDAAAHGHYGHVCGPRQKDDWPLNEARLTAFVQHFRLDILSASYATNQEELKALLHIATNVGIPVFAACSADAHNVFVNSVPVSDRSRIESYSIDQLR